jgi:carboxyl-terminal processing protease
MKTSDIFYNSLIVTCVAILVICGIFYYKKGGLNFSKSTKYDSFSEVMKIIENNYVDSTDAKAVNNFAISQVLASLDPFSKYLNHEDSQVSKSKLQGKFDGIGIEFSILEDTIAIVSPLNGSPADRGGLMTGDKIVKIDNKRVIGNYINEQFVKEQLKGPKGTNVKLEILRTGNPKLMSFNLIRDKIPMFSINNAYLISPEIGFIKINAFTENTHQDFVQSLSALKKQGMKNLILDLRNNPGGYVNSAISILDEFVSGNKLLAYTDGKNKEFDEKFVAQTPGVFEQGNLVVLINEHTASAAEIVAGSLQDNDRALIIGTKSFGKGLVQLPMDMPDGSELRLTVSRYYIPSGRNIQKPYLSINDSLFVSKINKPNRFKTISGREVYDGGGITPDLTAVNDSTGFTKFLSEILKKNVMKTVAYQFVQNNKQALSSYTFDDFNKKFTVSKNCLNEVKSMAKKGNIKFDNKDFIVSQKLIELQIKAFIARSQWNRNIKNGLENEYFKVIHPSDKVVQKAILDVKNSDKILRKNNFKELGLL